MSIRRRLYAGLGLTTCVTFAVLMPPLFGGCGSPGDPTGESIPSQNESAHSSGAPSGGAPITSKAVCDHTTRPGVMHCEAHVKTSPDGRVRPTTSPSGYSPANIQSAYSLPTSGAGGKVVALVEAYDNPN